MSNFLWAFSSGLYGILYLVFPFLVPPSLVFFAFSWAIGSFGVMICCAYLRKDYLIACQTHTQGLESRTTMSFEEQVREAQEHPLLSNADFLVCLDDADCLPNGEEALDRRKPGEKSCWVAWDFPRGHGIQ